MSHNLFCSTYLEDESSQGSMLFATHKTIHKPNHDKLLVAEARPDVVQYYTKKQDTSTRHIDRTAIYEKNPVIKIKSTKKKQTNKVTLSERANQIYEKKTKTNKVTLSERAILFYQKNG